MEFTMYYENTVLERPKQLNIDGKGKYCCIPVCRNAQYGKDWQKTNIGLFKFADKDAKPDLYNLWCNKIKTFQRAGGKDLFKVTNNTYVCEFHFSITDINVSAGRHIKTLKPNVVPSVFTFIKNKSSDNQPKRRSPRKRHLITEFVKPQQKKLTPEIIDADTPPHNSLKNNDQKSSSVVYKNCERLSFESILLKEKVKILEEEKNKLEEELKCSNVYAGSLKSRLFSYDNFITDETLFRGTTGLDVEKFKILYEYLGPGEIVKTLYTMNLQKIRRKIGQMFCLHQAFCHPHQNQDLDQNLLALTNYSFFIMVKTWFTTDTCSLALYFFQIYCFQIYHYMGEFYLLQVRLCTYMAN